MGPIVPKPLGIFAKAHLETEALFSELQAESMLYIQEAFSMEQDSFKLEGASWEEFFQRKAQAEKDGKLDEFDAQLMQELLPLIQSMIEQGAA